MGFSFRPRYYFITAIVKGKPYVLGPFGSEKEAQDKAWEKLQGVVWDIVESTNKDPSKITQLDKYERWDETGDIEAATQRVRHQI